MAMQRLKSVNNKILLTYYKNGFNVRLSCMSESFSVVFEIFKIMSKIAKKDLIHWLSTLSLCFLYLFGQSQLLYTTLLYMHTFSCMPLDPIRVQW